MPAESLPEFTPDIASHQKQRELTPTKAEALEAFGDSRLSESINPKTGTLEWNVRAEGRREMELLGEMMRPAWRHSTTRREKLQGSIPREILSDGTSVVAWNAKSVSDRSGIRPKIHWGKPGNMKRETSLVNVGLECGHRRWADRADREALCPFGCGTRRVV